MLRIRTQAHDTHIYTYIYTRIYIYIAILIISKNYIKANESIAGWLNGLLVSMYNYILRRYSREYLTLNIKTIVLKII